MTKFILWASAAVMLTIFDAKAAETPVAAPPVTLDHLWVIISAALVFLMQAGFKCFEVGMGRSQHATGIGMKNVVDWCVGTVFFVLVGFGIMFGKSGTGFFGTSLFGLEGLGAPGGSSLGLVFFMFQLAFAGTAITIVSGAMSERTGFIPYLTLSGVIGLVIYPVFGHWVWGAGYFADNKPWLASLGFLDFAGSSVVHLVGATVAVVGIKMVGPRTGRYGADGRLIPMAGSNPAYAMLGVFILWFGWWGFNGGSTLALNDQVGLIITNTNIAAAIGGLAAYFHAFFFQRKEDIVEKFLGGVLGGLVAVTACCNVVTPMTSMIVGLLAGVVHNLSFDLVIKRLRLDDPVGAIPVHGACGVLGILCVALLGRQELLPNPRLAQLGIQAFGCVVCVAWTASLAYVAIRILKVTTGLRVSPLEERVGITLGVPPREDAAPEPALDEEELRKLMAG